MIRCYRGVAKGNLHYSDALQGIARPIGGSASVDDHCFGDTESKYTSWTTRRSVAVEKALDTKLGGRGVVLTKDFSEAELISSPDFYDEAEVLVVGVVTDASVEWVP
ncbi:MAG: hypothetical protein ACRYFS_18055 [Janthinobacterium lividum]